MACLFVREAFGEDVFLVGSALRRLGELPGAPYRDVDVRVVISDERHRELFGTDHVGHSNVHPLRVLLCASISQYLSSVTGLPVDFQVQQASYAKAYADEPRHPLTLFIRGDEIV